jgi:hypothetical protein
LITAAPVAHADERKEALLLHLLERLEAETEEETDLTGVPLRDGLFRVLESIRRTYLSERSDTNLAVLTAEIRTLPERPRRRRISARTAPAPTLRQPGRASSGGRRSSR